MVDVTHLPAQNAEPSTPRASELERVSAPPTQEAAAFTPPPAVPEIPAVATRTPRPIEAPPPVSMALPADSGLEMIETRAKGASMSDPEVAPPAGPRRVRPPRVVVADEPLQIVETRKDSAPPPG